ncbi:L,D-transpeptidase family protein [uncultured Ottowia sp.]|uniref:L,D-transpeptidase family protein n=1 Tax=uncultured Ottowia sp. TaxID=543067 RepID=UPI0025985485|nr:L,D-transpeptidase family protein [uncultured Ottowia sp.]
MPLSRRRWLQAAAFALAAAPLARAQARSQRKRRSAYPIAPGRSFWLPELSPAGPVVAVVNLYTQHAQIYRNGIAIGYTSVSTGKRGYGTPTGRFQVLEKRRFHRSSTYGNAPMPWMVRLTWSGIAFHSGALPGFPASHGCIRLPASFAPQLFGALSLGDTVAVLNQPADAFTTLAPIDPLGRPLLQPEMLAATAWWREAAASAAPVSASPVSASLLTGAPASLAAPPLALLASLPQQRLFVLEAGQVAAAAPLPPGARQQALPLAAAPLGWQPPGHWQAPGQSGNAADATLWQTVLPSDAAFSQRLRDRITPGSTLVLSDLPAVGDLHLAAWKL